MPAPPAIIAHDPAQPRWLVRAAAGVGGNAEGGGAPGLQLTSPALVVPTY